MFLGKGGGGGAQSMRSDGGFRRLTGEGFTRAGVLTRGGRILFFTPTSRWRTVTAHLLFVKSYHRAIDGCLWLSTVRKGQGWGQGYFCKNFG